ncbi:MAG: hypothetical protein E7517_05905 [Ruminococcaceae bacterium]|nr:hypothetical protein [Oscillospiraceae bacterium]
MKNTKKILAVVLSVMLLISVMPFAAFAADPEGAAFSTLDGDSSYYYLDYDAYLDEDVTTSKTIYASAYGGNNEITLDLNGHTFSTTADQAVFVDSSSGPITLIIKDSSMGTKKTTYTLSSDKVNNMPTGKIETTGARAIYNTGNVVINGGAIVGASNAIVNGSDANGYNITVNNGYLEGGSYTISSVGTNCNITVNGGVVYGKHMGIGLNGTKSGNTININGGYVIGKTDAAVAEGGAANAAIYFPGNDTLNIAGGYIYGINSPAVVIRGGDVNITKGTITSTGDYNVTVAGASPVVPTAAIVVDTQANYPGAANLDVDISGGTITSTNAADAVAVVKDSADANAVAITGGTFKANGSGSDVSAYVDTDTTGKVVDANGKIVDALFEVNGVKYAHITDAMAAVPTNGTQTTVKLLKDVSDSGYGGAKVLAGQNVIFDLDGNTWTLRGTVGSTGTKTNGFQFLDGSTVTIKDGTINASLSSIYTVIQNYGDLTIDNATINANFSQVNRTAVSSNNGSVTIKDSTIYMKSTQPTSQAISLTPGWSADYKDASMVIENSTITGAVAVDSQAADSTAELEFKGTTTLDGDIRVPEDATGEFTVKNSGTGVEAPEGYKWDDNGILVELQDTTVAVIGSTEYTTLEDAIAAVQDGETIKLVSDVNVAATIVINDGKNFTIDTNGKTISSTVRVFEIRNGGVTLTGNGTLETTAVSAVAVYGSADSSAADYATFTLGEDATISAPSGYGAMIGANNKASYGAKLTIDGTINSLYGIYINGNIQEPADKTNAAQVTINGTVNAGSENAAVYAAGYAKWTVNEGATIAGGSGIYIKSGDLAVNGGTITANGAKVAYVFNTNGCNGTGDAIIIDSCGYPGNVPTVAINGGTISSTNGEAVASYTKQDDPRYSDATFERVDEVIPATSTAVFSTDVSDLAEKGYITVYDEEAGGYVVEQISANNGSSLTLNDGVSLNVYLDADAYGLDENAAVVKVTYNHNADVSQEKAISTDTIPLSEATRYIKMGDPYSGDYKFSFKMAPAQFAEDVTIALYENEDAQTPEFSATTNVKAKCDQVINLAETNDAYASYATLCGALEDYCVASQVYFNYDAPAAPAYNNDAVTTMDANDMEVPSAFVGIDSAGFSFTIVSALEVNVFYNGDLDIQNVSIDSTKGADAVKAETTTKSGRNCINITGVASGNLDNVITVNTSEGVVELSATNIAKAIAASSNNINYVNLARALYLYSVQASSYFGC